MPKKWRARDLPMCSPICGVILKVRSRARARVTPAEKRSHPFAMDRADVHRNVQQSCFEGRIVRRSVSGDRVRGFRVG
jgi:hypothetical protein